MSEKKGKKMCLRISKRGKHIYGFIPEGGAKEGDSVIIPIQTKTYEGNKYFGIVSLLKKKADFVAASIIEKDVGEDATKITGGE